MATVPDYSKIVELDDKNKLDASESYYFTVELTRSSKFLIQEMS